MLGELGSEAGGPENPCASGLHSTLPGGCQNAAPPRGHIWGGALSSLYLTQVIGLAPANLNKCFQTRKLNT